MELHILLAEGFPQPATQLLSNHYNRTRAEYYRQLDRASREGPHGFLLYAVQGFVDELRAQVDRVWAMQYGDRWEQYVYEQFGQLRTDTQRRQLRLIKDLSSASIKNSEHQALPELHPVQRG